jgi:hypothetical protein
MKLKLTALLLFIILFAQVQSSQGQSATTMQDILETVTEKVIYLEDTKDQEIVNISIDLLVNKGKKVLYRYLDPSFDYIAIAIGDRRISSLRLKVYKKNEGKWEYVTEESGNSPQISLLPRSNDEYEFTISVDEFEAGERAGHYAILLYHKDPLKD